MKLFGQKKELDLGVVFNELVENGVSDINGDTVTVIEVGELGTWPRTNNAIVKFEYQSVEEPYIMVDGERRGNIVYLCCQMADWTDNLIVDPTDGEIKQSGHYGVPVAWVSYDVKKAGKSVSKKNKAPDPRDFTVLEDTDAWAIARRVKQPAEDLISHNDIEDPHHIPAGTVLHLPWPVSDKKEAPVIKFELLDKARRMHVIREGGTRKWAFGNAKTWDDISPTGPNYAENANVEILMIAHVPLEEKDENGNNVVAAYMMDSLAVGDYRNSGKIVSTIGFSHKHLADGHAETQKKAKPAPVAEPKLNTATVADIELALSKPAPDPVKDPNFYKTTQKVINEDRTAKTYLANDNMMVHEMDGRRPDRPLYKHQGVKIFSTFEKDGVLYGRPLGSVDTGYWFGIPMDKLIDEEELYNTNVDLPTRVAMHGTLTVQERGVVALSRFISVGTRIATMVKKQKTTKEQK